MTSTQKYTERSDIDLSQQKFVGINCYYTKCKHKLNEFHLLCQICLQYIKHLKYVSHSLVQITGNDTDKKRQLTLGPERRKLVANTKSESISDIFTHFKIAKLSPFNVSETHKKC